MLWRNWIILISIISIGDKMSYTRKKSKYADGSKPTFRYDTKELMHVINDTFREYGVYIPAYEKEFKGAEYKKSGCAGYIIYSDMKKRIKKLKKLK